MKADGARSSSPQPVIILQMQITRLIVQPLPAAGGKIQGGAPQEKASAREQFHQQEALELPLARNVITTKTSLPVKITPRISAAAGLRKQIHSVMLIGERTAGTKALRPTA